MKSIVLNTYVTVLIDDWRYWLTVLIAGACTDALAIYRDVELVLFESWSLIGLGTVVSSRFLEIFYSALIKKRTHAVEIERQCK